LQRARQQARVTYCLTNLRSQWQVIVQYASDHGDRLPPRHLVWSFEAESTVPWLINRFLAHYGGQPFDRIDGGDYHRPAGIWRCPDVAEHDDDERRTHSGMLHHAPNRYLFNSVWWDDIGGEYSFSADVYPGWDAAPEATSWRTLAAISRPSEIIALIDNVNFFSVLHRHREARENVGRSYEVINVVTADSDYVTEYSHAGLGLRPAVFVDGHAQSLPAALSYWLDLQTHWQPAPGLAPVTLYAREVQRFMWFTKATESVP
jgi:hypothetical protein